MSGPELTGGQVTDTDSKLLILAENAHDIVIPGLIHPLGDHIRSRSDHADHVPLYNAFGCLGIFHLFADCHPVALLHQLVDVGLTGMKWHTAHGSPLLLPAISAGQGDLQLLGCLQRIIEEHLIEISQPVEQNTIFVFIFYLKVLLHHRSQFCHDYAILPR